MIVVFAGKAVGARLLDFLLARRDPVARVIAASAADESIVSACAAHGVPCEVFSKPLIEDIAASGERFDWLLNLWSPHILSDKLLGIAQNRANLHPSLVPHARGSDSTAWVLRKDLPAGVSVIEMNAVVDGGRVYAQREVAVDFPIRGSELHGALQTSMVALFEDAWPDMLAGRLLPIDQQPGGSFHLRKHTNADRIQPMDARMTLGEAVSWMLAHDFHPGTTAELERGGERYRLRLTVEKLPQNS